jgi:ribonuclease HI
MSMKKQTIVAYTDGSSLGNPGKGGWGAVIVFGDRRVKEIGGNDADTTNNRMELMATIEALRAMGDSEGTVEIHTDSQYVKNGITGWVFGWQKKNWMTANKQPVLNRELWEELVEIEAYRKKIGDVSWHYVAGHTGHGGNERADDIAVLFAKKESVDLYEGPREAYPVDLSQTGTEKNVADRSAQKKRSRAKAYSYLSLIDGVMQKHATWAECEARVKCKNAKFKKAISAEDEKHILKKWGVE